MPEAVSPGEVAYPLGHHADRMTRPVEIGEAILLAVVAIATAWSGYQTARLDARQAHT